jgi:hypothetical protein
VVSLAAVITITLVLLHLQGHDDWTTWDRVMLYSIGTMMFGWCIWVIRLFHDIILWWRNMYDEMSRAALLLEQSRQDLIELRKISTQN